MRVQYLNMCIIQTIYVKKTICNIKYLENQLLNTTSKSLALVKNHYF